MTDTHSHIYLKQFSKDLREVLDRAAEAGVKEIYMPAIDFGSLEEMEKMSHPKIRFHKMAGIHPCEVTSGLGDYEVRLRELATRGDIAAIGETGLDYYWSTDFIKEQKQSLHLHCEVAKDAGKPVILHNRNSTKDLLDIITAEQDGNLRGIWHCFNGTLEEGKRALDLNLYLGIGGVITFKNAGVDKTTAKLPLSRMVLETDAPYLAPHPNRGKRNEPAFISYTARRLAGVKEISYDEVIEITSANAEAVFGHP